MCFAGSECHWLVSINLLLSNLYQIVILIFFSVLTLSLHLVLARAIQSFARIGSELFIAANVDGLSLRTANLTKSAFAMILFYPDFFLDYNVRRDDDPLENQCKLSMKSCLGVFRNMKQVRE